MLDTLFGEGQSGLKILFFVIVVLVLLALAFWLLRRFGGGRLRGGAARGRQPRLAVIDQATVDGRRRLVLIRRDNVEHLLIIGGPTDVVVEQNIVRAATAAREGVRPPAADTLPRAVPLGEDSMWPLQPEPAPKPEAAARVEPSVRAEPRPPRPPMASEEPMVWPGERPDEPQAATPPVSPVPPRERKPRAPDPLAELADELSRVPGVGGPAEQRRMPRLQPAPTPTPSTTDPALKSPADQNLSEMAQRLEAALRRPGKSDETRTSFGVPRSAGEPASETSPRVDTTLRRPFKPDDLRPGTTVSKSEPAAPATDEAAAEPAKAAHARSADAKPGQQKSFYDSLEQEMASLLNRPPPKP